LALKKTEIFLKEGLDRANQLDLVRQIGLYEQEVERAFSSWPSVTAVKSVATASSPDERSDIRVSKSPGCHFA
jgi:hypothetical protein